MTVALNLYAPRHIRLVRGIVSCPQCHRKCFKNFLQHGRSFQTCEHARCDVKWLCLALPPQCFGGWLAATIGEKAAIPLIATCWPHLAPLPAPDLWYAQLTDGEEPAWIQIAVRPRERHLYRQANASDFLPLLLTPAA